MPKVLFLWPFIFLLLRQPPAYFAAGPKPFRKHGPTVEKKFSLSITIDGFSDPALQTDTPSCTLPFTRAGKLILLKGKAENTEGNFVLDTGAPYPVLNSTYFRDLEPVHNGDEVQRGINGEGDLTQKAIIKQLRLGTFSYFKVETDLLNLGPIENARGIKILGLLGVSLFKECELIIDYEKSLVHLHRINRREKKTYRHPMLGNPQEYDEHPFTLRDNRIVIQTRLKEKNLQFVIDCAAESNIIDSRLPGAVLDSVQISGRTLLSGAGTKKVEAITGAMSGITFDGMELKALPVIITSLENSCFGNDMCISGVLGYDFLSRYRLVFNFVTCKLYVFK